MNVYLNEAQQSCVTHLKGPMMVLAGPGSGKTTVILHRLKYLVEEKNINPDDILVINYTKSATMETRQRCKAIFNAELKFNIATFHSFFYRILRAHTKVGVEEILTDTEKQEVLQNIIKEKNFSYFLNEEFLKNIEYEISTVKNDLIDLQYYNSMTVSTEDFLGIYEAYEKFKAQNNRLDFDDMLEKCYNLLKENPKILEIWQNRFKFVMVDEFQDINTAQYRCVRLICEKHKNIFAVGDDDQSIYRFRGARPEIMFEFEKDFEEARKVVLDVNYRSTNEIIKFASNIIKGGIKRFEKEIKSDGKEGKKPVIMISPSVTGEAVNIAKRINGSGDIDFNDICVLYRTNTQSRAFVDVFKEHKIPFKVRDGGPSIYEHFIVSDICAYLRLSYNYTSNEDIIRIINKPSRYVSKDLIRGAKASKSNLIDYIYAESGMENWQLKKFDDFAYKIAQMRNMDTYKAIKHIRRDIGYDEYLNEYCEYRKTDKKAMLEIINEITDASKTYMERQGFLKHVEESIEESKEKRKKPADLSEGEGVTLSTMHGAKGLEFDKVFVASCVDGVIPYKKSKSPSEIDEERRLFYVAATRAKNELYISLIQERFDEPMEISPFLGFCAKYINKYF